MPSMPGIITSTIAASNGIAPRELEPLARRRRQADLVALARQQRLEDLAHDLLVVDDQNGCRCIGHVRGQPACATCAPFLRRRSGSASVNRVPCPTCCRR